MNFCHICDISWKHGATLSPEDFRLMRELVVTFDSVVRNGDLHANSVRVQFATREPRQGVPRFCFCDLDLRLEGGDVRLRCDATSGFTPATSGPNAEVDAVRIEMPRELLELATQTGFRMRILINGDFIRGRRLDNREWRAVDADHLPKPPSPGGLPQWLETLDDRVSGDGIEGGTFESWFEVAQRG